MNDVFYWHVVILIFMHVFGYPCSSNLFYISLLTRALSTLRKSNYGFPQNIASGCSKKNPELCPMCENCSFTLDKKVTGITNNDTRTRGQP